MVLAEGYYEWSRKQPYYIHQNQLLYMAGLWRQGEQGPEYVILTTAASPELASIHHRMPVFLNKEQLGIWMDPKASLDELNRFFVSCTGFKVHPVSTRVNQLKQDGPTLIQPVRLSSVKQFFKPVSKVKGDVMDVFIHDDVLKLDTLVKEGVLNESGLDGLIKEDVLNEGELHGLIKQDVLNESELDGLIKEDVLKLDFLVKQDVLDESELDGLIKEDVLKLDTLVKEGVLNESELDGLIKGDVLNEGELGVLIEKEGTEVQVKEKDVFEKDFVDFGLKEKGGFNFLVNDEEIVHRLENHTCPDQKSAMQESGVIILKEANVKTTFIKSATPIKRKSLLKTPTPKGKKKTHSLEKQAKITDFFFKG